MLSRGAYALYGLLSALVGMAVGHVVASLLQPDSSPLFAVGSFVVDLGTEGSFASIKDWAIEQFGENDKVFLVGTVMAGVAVLALVAGLLTRVRFRYGAGLLVVLVAIAGAAVVIRPAFEVLDLVPSVLAAVAAVAALWWLQCAATGRPLDPRARSTAEIAKAEAATAAPRPERAEDEDGELVVEIWPGSPEADERPKPSRRGVLIAAGVLTAAAAVFGTAGRLIGQLRSRAEDIVLPQPAAGETAAPLPRDLSATYPQITPLQVSNADFYRVDTRLDVPVVASDTWSLKVTGDVEEEFEISFDELLAMPMVERDITLTCVSNSVGGKYVGGARWLGVPLKTIIDRANPGSGVDQMLATDFDGMTIGTPYDLLTDGREALLAVGMNGEQLPREHGFPARIIIPGLYGFISATKWVTQLDFTTYAAQESYWTQRNWDTRAPIKPSARIDTPRGATPISGDGLIIGGVAWAQNDGGVSKVQVRIDGGPWMDATTGPDVNNVYWRQWYFEAPKLSSGSHNASARVVDGDGKVQTDVRANPFPGGASGIHTLLFNIE